MLEVLSEKQNIYFKNPPLGFYDLNHGGGNQIEDTVLESFHEYDRTEWYHSLFSVASN